MTYGRTYGRAVVIVTGASRGIGAEICSQFCSLMEEDSMMVGIARDAEKLKKTGELVNSKGVKFTPLVMDLVKPNIVDFESTLQEAIGSVSSNGKCNSLIIVHNAACLGELKYLRDTSDMKAVSSYFDLNLSSLYPLNSIFIKEARKVQANSSDLSIEVVNLSSISAIKPFVTWGFYSTGKAARDMFFKVLAEEEKDVHVLNYSPGPVETDMLAHLSSTPDEKFKKEVEAFKDAALTPPQTVEKMMSILQEGNYKSGDHVDYFD